MPGWNILFDLLVLLSTGLVLGALAEQFKQSALIGYLLGGMLVGPNILGIVEAGQEVTLLAELGAALLLFSIGLEFSLKRLLQQGKRIFLAGLGQVVLTALFFLLAVFALGLSLKVSIVIGAAATLSSTVCVIKVLRDRAEADGANGRQAISILLVQDAAVVPLLLLVSALGSTESATAVVSRLFWTLLGSAVVFVLLFFLFNRLIPKLLRLGNWALNRDLPILLTVVLALGTAWTAHQLGLSPALGAFLAGLFLAESPFATQIRADIEPLKVLLVALFFTAIGMYADPSWMANNFTLVIGSTAAIILGKALLIFIILRFFGVRGSIGLATAVTLAQIGEFSFVLLEVAQKQNLISQQLFLLLISVTIISLLLTPYLISLANFLRRFRPANESMPFTDLEELAREAEKILIIGFGPAGFQVVQNLSEEYRSRLIVIDLNPAHSKRVLEMGITYHVGDASRREILEHASAAKAGLAVITLPDPKAAQQIIRLLRGLRPQLTIISRLRYNMFAKDFIKSGSDVVIDEELEVGQSLARAARQSLEF